MKPQYIDLIPMTDCVIHLSKNGYKEFDETRQDLKGLVYSDALKIWITNKLVEYAKLLKQPLKLGMFIPCDLEGNVLEKPNKDDDYYRDANGIAENYFEDLKFYNEALDRVIFEGFEILKDDGLNVFFKEKPQGFYWNRNRGLVSGHKTIEDLTNLGLKIKKI